MIRILLAEDHGIVREGMKHLFALNPEITVTAEAVNGQAVLDNLRRGEFDLILLDMTMPGISGVDLIKRILNYDPDTLILILSMHNEPQIAKRALNAGAMGYVTKDSEPEILLAAIRRVARGRRFIDPVLAEQMVFTESAEERILHEQLSGREYEILIRFAKGMSLNEIADALAISNKTVSTHKARLMQKMELDKNADLVRYAIVNGLVS